MQRFRRSAGRLPQPFGSPAGRRRQQHMATVRFQAVAEQAQDRRLTGSGAARQDHDRFLERLAQGVLLLRRQNQIMPDTAV